jgi:hypothetical protein
MIGKYEYLREAISELAFDNDMYSYCNAIRCTASDDRHTCYIDNVIDMLTNEFGADVLSIADATIAKVKALPDTTCVHCGESISIWYEVVLSAAYHETKACGVCQADNSITVYDYLVQNCINGNDVDTVDTVMIYVFENDPRD